MSRPTIQQRRQQRQQQLIRYVYVTLATFTVTYLLHDPTAQCPYTTAAVLGKNIWGAWSLIIWEATTAKRNYYITNKKIGGRGWARFGRPVPPALA